MAKLTEILRKLPKLNETRMVSNGYCIWVAWRGDLHSAVAQTLSDYGAMQIDAERDQALWFIFSTDAFLALARLEVWSRLNQLPVFLQIFPAKLLLGFKLEVSLAVEGAIEAQEALIPQELEIWVHPRAREDAVGIPGLEFKEAKSIGGLAQRDWTLLTADPRLPYQSSLGWYGVLKPLGNPLDKNFQAGWRAFFEELEKVIKQMRLKFILHESYVIFALENLRELRTWCKQLLGLVRHIKEEQSASYWPCVLAITGRKNLSFNAELPKKLALDYDMLMPDFPHMSYRTAFLMGEGFRINDVRFSVDQSSVEDWCNISLAEGEEEQLGSLPVEMPPRVVTGSNQPCFYCGLRNHEVSQCPSRTIESLQPRVWSQLAQLNFKEINEGLQRLDEQVAGAETPLAGMGLLLVGEGVDAFLLQAMFQISSVLQFRMMRTVWQSHGKDYPGALEQLGPLEDTPAVEALRAMYEGDHIHADRLLNNAIMRSPRNYTLRTVQGFVAMERGDMPRALALWKEAEGQSATPLQQAYHLFLQGRVMEMGGRFQNASALYKQVLALQPRWLDAQYRQGVCLVKMGFAEQAMSFFEALFDRDPHYFNRILIDPELERGHLHLLSSMYNPWVAEEAQAEAEKDRLERFRSDLAEWFVEGHPFFEEVTDRVQALLKLGEVQNYVAFRRIVKGRQALSRDFERKIEEETRRLKQRFQGYMDRLRHIREEAAWFPFPKLLIDFNKDFNSCARSLNWGLSQHFTVADTFKRAQHISEKVEETLEQLEGKLRTLKVVRDSTLFLLIMGKTFFWLEMIGLVMILIGLPLAVYYGQEIGLELSDLVVKQKWEIQKGLVMVLSICALGLAALRTVVVFEKKRKKLFEKMNNLAEGRKK